jgi:hypothetical protein
MRRVYATLVLLALAGAAPAADKFEDLTPLLPPQANAATVIDVQAIYNSPLAQKEKWSTQRPLPIPPTLFTAALASRVEPGTPAGGKWEIGVARLRANLTIEQIAAREKGAVDNIAGSPAVLSPRNVFFVNVNRPFIIGMVSPADRQEAADWIRQVRGSTGVVNLRPFLSAAVTAPNVTRDTQFVMAIDLADAVSPDMAQKRFAAAPVFAGKPADAAAAANLFATVRGVRLTLLVTDSISGELRFEFGEPAAPLVPVAKPLMTEYLSRRGASVEAVEDWTAEADGNWLVMRGSLRENGFRRILGMVAPAAPPADISTGNPNLAAELRSLATQWYYRSIQAELDDLRRPSRRTQQDFARFATWYDTFAQKIEQLPPYNVDEDVAKYGMATAARLRGIAASLRGVLVDVKELEKKIAITPYIFAQGGWGGRLQPGVWLETNEGQIRAQQQAAIEQGAQARQDLWSRIDNESAAIGRIMAERYPATVGK